MHEASARSVEHSASALSITGATAVMFLGLSVGLLLPSSARAIDASARGLHAPPGGVYGGRSAQDHPMSLRLTRDGKRLKSLTVHVDAGMCSSSPTTYTLGL